jgi:phosphorylcholine metabolism protein LicD
MNHEKNFKKALVGKKIKDVQYMTAENADEMGWDRRPLIIIFDDDTYIFAQSDDEGNEGGVLNYQGKAKNGSDDLIIYTL